MLNFDQLLENGFVVLAIAAPIIYAAAGFIAGLIFALIYNLVACSVGCLEFEVDKK